MLLVTNIGSYVRSVLAPTRRCVHMVDGAGARRSIVGAALVSGGAELVGGHPPWTRREGSVCGPSGGGREEWAEPGGILQNQEVVIAHPEDGLRSTGGGGGRRRSEGRHMEHTCPAPFGTHLMEPVL